MNEADYVIITPEDRIDLVLMQLEDLGLYDYHGDPAKQLTQIFYDDVFDFKIKEFLCCGGVSIKDVASKKSVSCLAIKVPLEKLDETAEKTKMETPLTYLNTDMVVKAPFIMKN